MTVDPNIDPAVTGRHNGFDVYPMPMFARLETRDLAATVRWYGEALEFAVMFGMPMMAHLRRKKFQDLLIFASASGGSPAQGLALSFGVESEVEAIWRRASEAGPVGLSKVEGSPQVTLWNALELRIRDPDGRLLVFHEQAKDAEASARMKALFKTGAAL